LGETKAASMILLLNFENKIKLVNKIIELLVWLVLVVFPMVSTEHISLSFFPYIPVA
jgi:hypothetical protein